MTPAKRRKRRLWSIAHDHGHRGHREGLQINGVWLTPDEIHAICKARMEWFDSLPPLVRADISHNGKMPKKR